MINKKLFKLFLLIYPLSLFVLSCNNKSTAPVINNNGDNKSAVYKTITKDQILNVFKSLSAFEVGGETWDFSQITNLDDFYNIDAEKLYDYQYLENVAKLTSSKAGSASVNALIKKLEKEVAPKLDEIGIYFPEDVTTVWGDPNSTRPLRIIFSVKAKNGYIPDKEIEKLFDKELLIVFITKAKWVS
ncbi:hypothetical protein [Brachyspira hyodysenteriae]|uniref:hypothetical protein n=1 Tax=Brachyspira hyodysenteriae TaxID=159 RepID=UPI0022CE0934|nr:hypothetical protein [Brachyspira hyodysenteriae]MCZ9889907.1 hypothetical protein [Brachyspira hyodysenteriae]